jgi:DNA helicase-2/ATP-dependent DNA helicase PcrA
MARKKLVVKSLQPAPPQLSILDELETQKYTEEQKAFVEYSGKESIILSATAGSGKTFSCVQRLKELLRRGVEPEKIIFFSFTNDAVKELTERIERDGIQVWDNKTKKGIRITTIHSFCLSILTTLGKYKEVADFYKFIEWFKEKYKPALGADQEVKDIFYETIGNLYEDSNFFSSKIAAYKLQTADKVKCLAPPFIYEYNLYLRETKARDFSDMLIEVRDLFREDKWLKMFRNKYDYIFVDEYQDTSTIQLQILLSLNATYYYLIGDKNQCVVEGTKIHTDNGIKCIEELKIGDKVLTGKGSDNLGYKTVTDVFKNKFSGEVIKIKTKSGKELITTREHTHFAKYVINEKELFFTYLMYKKGYGFRIGITRSYHNRISFDKGNRFGFMNRLNGEHAQKIWLLEASETLQDSKYWEQYYSLKYGIPTLVFQERDKITTQEFIDKVFKNINSEVGGLELLKFKDFDFNIPHHFPKSTNNLHDRNINICLCGDGRGDKSIHKLEIGGSSYSDREKIINAGLKVQNNGKGTGWRIRKQSNNFEDLVIIKNKFLSIVDGIENRNTLLKKGSALNFTKASYLIKGMTVYVLGENNNIEYDIIESVSVENYDGFVYDINIENTHNFIANGIFTHNSIYGYSGANCNLLEEMLKARRETKVMSLSVNFRSDQNIVENSNKFSSLKATANSKENGFVDNKFMVTIDELIEILQTPEQVAVLVRTNDIIKKLELILLRKKIPMRYFNFITDKDIKNFHKGEINGLLKNKFLKLKNYFESEHEIIHFIEMHKKSNKFITTIHKSKGREFETCVVVNSISMEILQSNPMWTRLSKKQLEAITFDPNDEVDVEPKNIHYVAVSRSKHKLYFMVFGC